MPPSNGKKWRKLRQRKRMLLQCLREDLQLSGDIPTVPEGGIRDERVDPAKQSEAPQVGLIVQALKSGWAVPDEKKPILVQELINILEDPEVPNNTKVAAFNALRMADQQQYERDNPELAAKAKGGTKVEVNNTNNQVVALGEVFSDIRMIEQSMERILGCGKDNYAEDIIRRPKDGGVRANGDAQPVDEAQSSSSQEEPETD